MDQIDGTRTETKPTHKDELRRGNGRWRGGETRDDALHGVSQTINPITR